MKALTYIIAAGLLFSGTNVSAQSSDPFYMSGAANACFKQTERAISGSSAVELSTAACNIALDNWSLSPAQEVSLLHNRGIIQLGQGYVNAAFASFEQAVEKSSQAGKPHLALAQLAQKRGDLVRAVELYDQLLAEEINDPVIKTNRDVIANNRDLAMRNLQQRQIANTTP